MYLKKPQGYVILFTSPKGKKGRRHVAHMAKLFLEYNLMDVREKFACTLIDPNDKVYDPNDTVNGIDITADQKQRELYKNIIEDHRLAGGLKIIPVTYESRASMDSFLKQLGDANVKEIGVCGVMGRDGVISDIRQS